MYVDTHAYNYGFVCMTCVYSQIKFNGIQLVQTAWLTARWRYVSEVLNIYCVTSKSD